MGMSSDLLAQSADEGGGALDGVSYPVPASWTGPIWAGPMWDSGRRPFQWLVYAIWRAWRSTTSTLTKFRTCECDWTGQSDAACPDLPMRNVHQRRGALSVRGHGTPGLLAAKQIQVLFSPSF